MKVPVSLLAMLLSASVFSNEVEEVSKIEYHVTLECPPSVERTAFEKIIPAPDYQSPNQEAWILSTVDELEHLITLVQSGNFRSGAVNISNPTQHLEESYPCDMELSLSFLCDDCQELEALEALEGKKKETKNYSEWSKETMQDLHDLQMLIYKGKVHAILPLGEKGGDTDHNLKLVSCSLSIKGPMSEEFQAVFDASKALSNSDAAAYTSQQERQLAVIQAIHKLELLILSGKINLGSANIQVQEIR